MKRVGWHGREDSRMSTAVMSICTMTRQRTSGAWGMMTIDMVVPMGQGGNVRHRKHFCPNCYYVGKICKNGSHFLSDVGKYVPGGVDGFDESKIVWWSLTIRNPYSLGNGPYREKPEYRGLKTHIRDWSTNLRNKSIQVHTKKWPNRPGR